MLNTINEYLQSLGYKTFKTKVLDAASFQATVDGIIIYSIRQHHLTIKIIITDATINITHYRQNQLGDQYNIDLNDPNALPELRKLVSRFVSPVHSAQIKAPILYKSLTTTYKKPCAPLFGSSTNGFKIKVITPTSTNSGVMPAHVTSQST